MEDGILTPPQARPRLNGFTQRESDSRAMSQPQQGANDTTSQRLAAREQPVVKNMRIVVSGTDTHDAPHCRDVAGMGYAGRALP